MTKASLQSVSIGGGVPLDQSLRGLLKLYGKRLRLTSAVFSLTSIHVGTFFAAVLVFRLSGLEIYPASQLTLAALAVLLAASMTTTAFRALRAQWLWESGTVFDLASTHPRATRSSNRISSITPM